MIGTTSTAASQTTPAHVVRLAATSLTVAVMAAVGMLQPTSATSADSTPAADLPASLSAAVDTQQSQGRTCQDAPTLTDTVLYQFAGSDQITVLTFDQAVRETARRSGWVRGYCA